MIYVLTGGSGTRGNRGTNDGLYDMVRGAIPGRYAIQVVGNENEHETGGNWG